MIINSHLHSSDEGRRLSQQFSIPFFMYACIHYVIQAACKAAADDYETIKDTLQTCFKMLCTKGSCPVILL